jgi:hypothetical protein
MESEGVQIPDAYSGFAGQVFARMTRSDGGPPRPFTRASDVTDAIWRAVTDPTCPIFQPAGADAAELAPPH